VGGGCVALECMPEEGRRGDTRFGSVAYEEELGGEKKAGFRSLDPRTLYPLYLSHSGGKRGREMPNGVKNQKRHREGIAKRKISGDANMFPERAFLG